MHVTKIHALAYIVNNTAARSTTIGLFKFSAAVKTILQKFPQKSRNAYADSAAVNVI